MRYISPFTLTGADPAQASLSAAELQAARKRLLAEFELAGNEATVELDGASYNRSELIAWIDSFREPDAIRLHGLIWRDRDLYLFLTKNSLPASGRFAAAPEYATDRFRELTGPFFVPVYAGHLEQAFRKRDLKKLRLLRQLPLLCSAAAEEECYRPVRRELQQVIDDMNKASEGNWPYRFEAREAELFSNEALIASVNLLPDAFASLRSTYAQALIDLAVFVFNSCQDTEKARQLLSRVARLEAEDTLKRKAVSLSSEMRLKHEMRQAAAASQRSAAQPANSDNNSWKAVLIIVKVIIFTFILARNCGKSSRPDYDRYRSIPVISKYSRDFGENLRLGPVQDQLAAVLLRYSLSGADSAVQPVKKKKKKKEKPEQQQTLGTGQTPWYRFFNTTSTNHYHDRILVQNVSDWDVVIIFGGDYSTAGGTLCIRAHDSASVEIPLMVRGRMYIYAGRNWSDSISPGQLPSKASSYSGYREEPRIVQGAYRVPAPNADSLLLRSFPVDRMAKMTTVRGGKNHSSYGLPIIFRFVVANNSEGGLRVLSLGP